MTSKSVYGVVEDSRLMINHRHSILDRCMVLVADTGLPMSATSGDTFYCHRNALVPHQVSLYNGGFVTMERPERDDKYYAVIRGRVIGVFRGWCAKIQYQFYRNLTYMLPGLRPFIKWRMIKIQ
jgi:hypothetical protein